MELELCRVPSRAGESFTVAMGLPCQSREGVLLTVAMACHAKAVRAYRTVAKALRAKAVRTYH